MQHPAERSHKLVAGGKVALMAGDMAMGTEVGPMVEQLQQ